MYTIFVHFILELNLALCKTNWSQNNLDTRQKLVFGSLQPKMMNYAYGGRGGPTKVINPYFLLEIMKVDSDEINSLSSFTHFNSRN